MAFECTCCQMGVRRVWEAVEEALHYSQPRVLSSLPHTASSSRGCLLTPWVSLWTFFLCLPSSRSR